MQLIKVDPAMREQFGPWKNVLETVNVSSLGLVLLD